MQYPIRTVSELTGVSATTLRAWERRYGLLKPVRKPRGHRLYSSQDVELIKEVVKLLKQDHTISQAVRIIRDPEMRTQATATTANHWDEYQQRLIRAIENFHEKNLDRAYTEALSIYPVDMVSEHVMIPVLKYIGENWQQRPAGIAEEHFFSSYLRNKLGARLHHESQRARGKKILVSCLPGEYHELGILLFCIAAIGRGYQVLYLGSNLPPAQLPLVAAQTELSAVLLSGTRPWRKQLDTELATSIKSLSIPFMLGGEVSDNYQDKIEKLGAHALGSDHSKALEKMDSIIRMDETS